MTQQARSNWAACILAWYHTEGRKNLPWHENRNPYRVWVSEIMLQQTQVKTVIPYFQRFMQQFPTVGALAAADLDAVLHQWTGLGYYARARNLHKAAQQIQAQFAGRFSDDVEQLMQLPGIGRSTAGAIRAQAFNKRGVILDGNVKRVLARQIALQQWTGTSAAQKQLWALAEQLTPEQQHADYTQAMMDLGATLCTRKPDCGRCPVQSSCLAHASGQQTQIPIPKPKKTNPVKTARLFVIQDTKRGFLLQQRPPVGIWGGLWTFPMLESATEPSIHTKLAEWGFSPQQVTQLAPRKHTFSHFRLDYVPLLIQGEPQPNTLMETAPSIWYNPKKPAKVGLAAPVQQLIAELNP